MVHFVSANSIVWGRGVTTNRVVWPWFNGHTALSGRGVAAHCVIWP